MTFCFLQFATAHPSDMFVSMSASSFCRVFVSGWNGRAEDVQPEIQQLQSSLLDDLILQQVRPLHDGETRL